MIKIEEEFKKYNLNITKEQINKINIYYNFLIEENNKYNLTNITNKDDFIIKHVIDSLLPYKHILNAENILDIGCGAGFPSVIFSIFFPEINILAIDSTLKKINFVNNVIKKLDLKNLKAKHTRIEDIKEKNSFDIVVGRAVAPLNVFLEYSVPFIKKNGSVLIYKSKNIENEINDAKNSFHELDSYIQKREDIEIFYNNEKIERTFLIVKKNSTTNKKYPRLKNKPRVNPL